MSSKISKDGLWGIILLIIFLIFIFLSIFLKGCVPVQKMTESEWRDRHVPADVNEAEAMSIMKEQERSGKQKSLCFWGMLLAVAGLGISLALKGLKIIQIPAAALLVAFGFGWAVSLAEIRFPEYLAYGGLVLAGLIIVTGIILVAHVIFNLIKSIEFAKADMPSPTHFSQTLKNKGKQSKITEKVVDAVQKKLNGGKQ